MIKKSPKLVLEVGICIASLALLLILINPFNSYYFFIIKSFAYQEVLFLSVLLICSVVLRRKIATIVVVFVLLVFGFVVSENFQKSYDQTFSDADQIAILHINMLRDNTEVQNLIELIEHEDPDILSLQELSVENYNFLKEDLDNLFPYRYVKPEDSYIELGIFSKFPIADSQTIYVRNYPIFHVKIEIQDKLVDLFALHTQAPFNRDMWISQSEMFQKLDELISMSTGGVIIVGDLNAVPWHNEFATMMRHNNLKAAHYSPFGTYPAGNFLVCVPIDHIIVSDDLKILETSRMSVAGSDHFGIRSNLQVN